jgi:glycosyltransferase involved in cell wall biosynthesis
MPVGGHGVYHGLPPDLLRASFEPGQYLAFLGRLAPDKGPEAAIRIARGAGIPLRMAAKLPRRENRYFKERLEPLIDGCSVTLIGEVDEGAKQQFLAGATALLIEAKACGTPVIAFRRGWVPEVKMGSAASSSMTSRERWRRSDASANWIGAAYGRHSPVGSPWTP